MPATGILPSRASPAATAIMFCSAMPTLNTRARRSGWPSSKSVILMDLEMSAWSVTTRGSAPAAASARPNPNRVGSITTAMSGPAFHQYSVGTRGWASRTLASAAAFHVAATASRRSTSAGSAADPPPATAGRARATSARAWSSCSRDLVATPCQPAWFSMKDTPFPFTVCSSTTVGRPSGSTARRKVARSASTSWPSTSSARQPKASYFSRIGRMSITSATGPAICRPLRSTTPTRFPSRWWAAAMAASQTEPSCCSPSPMSTNTRLARPSRRKAIAIPAPMPSPCPSEPVDTSTPASFFMSGWPCRGLPTWRSVQRRSFGKYPHQASAAYSAGALCPAENRILSRSGQSGRAGSCRATSRYSTAVASRMDSVPPGCPDPAAWMAVSASARISAAARPMASAPARRSSPVCEFMIPMLASLSPGPSY